MFDEDRAPEWPVTLTAPPARRVVTSCAAAFFVPGAVVRLVGQADGSIATDAVGIIGTLVLLLFAAIFAFAAYAAWSARIVVDDTEIEQRLGRTSWSVPLTAGTSVTLRRKTSGGPTWSTSVFLLRLERPDCRMVQVDTAYVSDFETALLAVSLAGRHEPSLLADPTLRAVLRDPGLLSGSKAELERAVADEQDTDGDTDGDTHGDTDGDTGGTATGR